ncbi:putative NAD dependent epimerase/dehydratase [Quillaja saponaria]|uniref:NAD dependent epimerase/dehydratase n=1 Tax=Quillaja saponaria TaxID=32244 RepID=A0AAD7M0E5_QUISA|nr:putative NAD dependent epimerase/dehydratase [Quillaja saponaria]
MEVRLAPGSAIPVRLRYGYVPKNFGLSLSMIPRSSYSSSISVHTNLSEPKSEKHIFILGLGFVGQFLGQELKTQGWAVSGTCTSHLKKKKLEEMGFDVYLFDAKEPELRTLDILKHHAHLLVCIPPVMGIGDPMIQHKEILRSSLINGNIQWLCYLSSTSVYGDCDGAWVDEDYPTNPTSELGTMRLAAEEGWSKLALNIGLSAQVFRLGGIYGPGRSAIDTIIKQELLSERQKMRASRKYTSRVHVKDICQALKASFDTPSLRKVYNIVDDDPAPREEVFEYARKLVEEKWPGLIKQSHEQTIESLERGEKRVSNSRMKEELGVELLYPNYKSGLQSIINQMESPVI